MLSEPKYIFICSPYRGNPISNTKLAKKICRVVALNTTYLPLAPHLYFTSFLNDDVIEERNKGIEAGSSWIEKSSFVFVIKSESGTISDGMLNEINFAKKISKPVIVFESYKQFYDIIANHQFLFTPYSSLCKSETGDEFYESKNTTAVGYSTKESKSRD